MDDRSPSGSHARLALNEPLSGTPGGGGIGVDPEPMQTPGAPLRS